LLLAAYAISYATLLPFAAAADFAPPPLMLIECCLMPCHAAIACRCRCFELPLLFIFLSPCFAAFRCAISMLLCFDWIRRVADLFAFARRYLRAAALPLG